MPLSLYRQAEWEIVGVVDDMKQGGLQNAGFVSTADTSQPEMFSSYRQFGTMRPDSVFFVARAAGDPARSRRLVRAIVREQAPDLVLDSVMSMDDRLMSSLSRPRAYALVLGGFAAFALAIAAVGLFGVLSYSVAQRSREIGVRTALGAQTTDVVALVLRSGMAITVAGLACRACCGGAPRDVAVEDSLRRQPVRSADFLVVPLVLSSPRPSRVLLQRDGQHASIPSAPCAPIEGRHVPLDIPKDDLIVIAGWLFGVAPLDTLTFATVSLLLSPSCQRTATDNTSNG